MTGSPCQMLESSCLAFHHGIHQEHIPGTNRGTHGLYRVARTRQAGVTAGWFQLAMEIVVVQDVNVTGSMEHHLHCSLVRVSRAAKQRLGQSAR